MVWLSIDGGLFLKLRIVVQAEIGETAENGENGSGNASKLVVVVALLRFIVASDDRMVAEVVVEKAFACDNV